jgi:hypothetical protein
MRPLSLNPSTTKTKPVVSLYVNIQLSEVKNEKAIPFMIATK